MREGAPPSSIALEQSAVPSFVTFGEMP